MGLFETVGNVAEFVTDTANKVKNAAKAIEFIAKRAGLDTITKFAGNLGKYAGPLAIAPTPILKGGQKIIEGMRSTTGAGDPEDAEGFLDGSQAFKGELETLADAHPDSRWEGGPAPQAYERRVGEQENRVATLADADGQIAAIVGREAGEIIETRRVLDNLHTWLADYGTYTQTLGVIPVVGKYIQMEAEMLAVGMALNDATAKMWEMHDCANANAAGVREVLETYQRVSAAAVQQDSIGDFDPPR